MATGILKGPGKHPMADEIRSAIGAGPDDVIKVVTPQFERLPSDPQPSGCPDRATLDRLAEMTTPELRELGLRPWGSVGPGEERPGDPILWLFPGEWYRSLPAGLPIVSISGERETFAPGETDSNTRYGCLAYGVLRQEH